MGAKSAWRVTRMFARVTYKEGSRQGAKARGLLPTCDSV